MSTSFVEITGISSERKSRAKKVSSSFEPGQIWIDRSIENHPETIRLLNHLQHIEMDVVEDISHMHFPSQLELAKQQLIITKHRGRLFRSPLGVNQHHLADFDIELSCDVGTPYECSYCPLQLQLKENPIPHIAIDFENIFKELLLFLEKNPDRFFRIGFGESADPLAFDKITGFCGLLIAFFAGKQNAFLELKTKTTNVDHLFSLKHCKHTILSWYLNTPEMIASEERGTASFEDRLLAAASAAKAGYRVGFHLDPIILPRGDQTEIQSYLTLIHRLFEQIAPENIAWIQLGLLRYPKGLPEIAKNRFSSTRIFTGEVFPDGNVMRPPRFLREAAYKPLWEALLMKLPPEKIFLSAETQQVWSKLDPTVTSSHTLEHRLRHSVTKPFAY